MKIAEIAAGWDRFFFSPVSPYPVAAYRILQGCIYLQFALALGPDLQVWYGYPGIILESTLAADGINKLNVLSYYHNNEWVLAVWLILIAASLCLTIGFQTRIASIILFTILVTYSNRNAYLFNAGDTYLRSVAFWLVFAPSAEVWSVDSWLKNRKKAPFDPLVSAWVWRALQLQLCFVYYSAFYTKTSGWYWSVGEAVYIASRFESLFRLPLPFTFDDALLASIFTFGTLAVEAALYTLIWVKELRYYVIALGTCLHLTIDWCMSIPMFEWMMIVSFVLFIDSVDITNFVAAMKCWLKNPLKVLQTPTKA